MGHAAAHEKRMVSRDPAQPPRTGGEKISFREEESGAGLSNNDSYSLRVLK